MSPVQEKAYTGHPPKQQLPLGCFREEVMFLFKPLSHFFLTKQWREGCLFTGVTEHRKQGCILLRKVQNTVGCVQLAHPNTPTQYRVYASYPVAPEKYA